MRIAFLTNTSSRVNLSVLRSARRLKNVELAHVFLYDTFAELRRKPWTVVKQYGASNLVSKVAQSFLAKVSKKEAFDRSQASSALQWCRQKEIAYTVVHDMNNADSIQLLKDTGADLLLVCVCKNILKPKALQACPLGAVNIHPSLLPEYRGPCPVFWATYFSEPRTGVTFHRMTAAIDRGAIVAQYDMEIDEQTRPPQIESDLFDLAARYLNPVLHRLAAGDTSQEFYPDHPGSYFSFPSGRQRKELQRRLQGR